MEGKKVGGRKAGVPNKVTGEIRQKISDFIALNMDEFQKNMALLKPKDYCDVYLGLCKYAIPALQAITLDDARETTKTIEDQLKKLSELQEKKE